MEGHAKKCVERYGELANKTTQPTLQSINSLHWRPSFQKRRRIEIRERSVKKYALRLFWNAYIWHVLEDLIFYGQWTNLHDRSRNGRKLVTNDWIVWYLTSITHVITNKIVMWVILPNKTDLDCFKTPILREILRTQNLLRVEHCAFSEVIRLFQSVGCARNKLQFHTVQQNQKSFLWMQDWGWMVFPLSWFMGSDRCSSWKHDSEPLKNGETRCWTNVKLVLHLTRYTSASNLREWSMIWIMSILFPQTSNLFTRKLCCMCLKITKQGLRWS